MQFAIEDKYCASSQWKLLKARQQIVNGIKFDLVAEVYDSEDCLKYHTIVLLQRSSYRVLADNILGKC